jgi:hypothetical protein
MENPSKLKQSPLERETQSYIRSVRAATSAAARGDYKGAFVSLDDAMRSISVLLGVMIKTTTDFNERLKVLEATLVEMGDPLTPDMRSDLLEMLRKFSAREYS